MRGLAVALFVVLAPCLGVAADYPCPSDPGFCYRDLGDDGCFDDGTDIGPIDTEIIVSNTLPPVPEPGSIVCPPSVKKLTFPGSNLRLETLPGSDILFYGTKIQNIQDIELISGGRVLLDSLVKGSDDGFISAVEDVVIEQGPNMGDGSRFVIQAGGDIALGDRTKFRAGGLEFRAPSGSIVVGENSNLQGLAGPIQLIAGGDLTLTRPRLKQRVGGGIGGLELEGANVTIHEKWKIKSQSSGEFRIHATAGDVSIGRLTASTNMLVVISGTNVSIGMPDGNGVVRSSRITMTFPSPIQISATGATEVRRITFTTGADSEVSTTGASLVLTDSRFRGKKATPTLTVSSGPGGTCDLTRTFAQSATLVTNCDTIVGP